jgi:hypothetical protein
VDAGSVDWSEFDLVIAIECAVPARITKCHPSVIWATLLENHRMRPYKAWLREAPDGYDLFLNLRYGPNPQSIWRRSHVIDWPYNFTTSGALTRLMNNSPEALNDSRPVRVLLEDNQQPLAADTLGSAGFKVTTGRRATLKDYLFELLRSDVLAFPSPTRPLGGLAMLDAASAGVLLVGNRRALWNPFVALAELHASTPDRVAQLVHRVVSNPAIRVDALARQNARLNWFGFARPLQQIAKFVDSSRRSISAGDHLARVGQT